MIADGIIMSKLIQLIQLWGGAHEFLLSFLQTLQNRAARLVTKSDWFTPTSVILKQCGWLSIRQLAVYHDVLQIFKIRQSRKPVYFYKKFSREVSQNTRLASTQGIIKETTQAQTDLGQRNFTFKATQLWNSLPPSIRTLSNKESFKTKEKLRIRETVPI